MNPRPFYRSRMFWFGLPGLVFLCWLWLPLGGIGATWLGSSTGSDWAVSAGGGGGGLRISYEELTPFGQLILFGVPAYEYGWNWYVGSATAVEARQWGWPPIQVEYGGDGGRIYRHLDVALWLLVAGYAVVWAAIYHMWQRRKTRLIKLQTAP